MNPRAAAAGMLGALLLAFSACSDIGSAPPVNYAAQPPGGVRVLEFSGYQWWVKQRISHAGPGPNVFSDSDESVWVDPGGRLHLRIRREGGLWWCAEVVSMRSFGYGSYRFRVESDVSDLDPNAVLGLFTWNDDPAFHHREIDVELSRWGDPDNVNAQFVVQPWTHEPNLVRFALPPRPASQHEFSWKPQSVRFRSEVAGETVRVHDFTHDVPAAGGENARINLWLIGGQSPLGGEDVEVVIAGFGFTPHRLPAPR